AEQLTGVQKGRRGDDGGAMLVVVKDRDAHAAPELPLDDETFRGADVLEVDTAKRRLKAGDDLNEPMRIFLIDLDVEDVDIRKALEEDSLSLHDGLGRASPDSPAPQHSGAVADDADEIAPRGIGIDEIWLADDLTTGLRDPGRIGQREVELRGDRFGPDDLDFSRPPLLVIPKSVFFRRHARSAYAPSGGS